MYEEEGQNSSLTDFFIKMGHPDLFLFIFVLFKNQMYRKTVDVSWIRTQIVLVEGEHVDHHHRGPSRQRN